MEGRVTRFSSGIAGVAIVLFALMGTIGVGYLLNGTSGYENVNDYSYVTDVTGLYSYTPVPAYAEYSPATNNYQYSDSLSTLGTYTSGINYTQAAAANLNPIITPSSGMQTVNGTIAYDSFVAPEQNGIFVMGAKTGQVPIGYTMIYKVQNLYTLIRDIEYSTLVIKLPSVSTTLFNTSMTVQQVGIFTPSSDTSNNMYNTLNEAIQAKATAAGNGARCATTSSTAFTYNMSGPVDSGTYVMNNPVGVVSDITVYANGTASYTYTFEGNTTTVTKPISEIFIISWGFANSGLAPSDIAYTSTVFDNVNYLDPNYGVSLTGDTAYWSNGNDLGSITWAFQKPTAASSIRILGMNDDTSLTTFTITYDTQWHISYPISPEDYKSIDLGLGWPAMYVRMYYTGEIQVGPIERFFNFTNYELGPAQTYSPYYMGNDPITYCKITGSTIHFAAIGTTVQSGTVPGAMYDATFNAGNYFPQYTDVRISFDSAAYVGTSVQVDTWTMSVDSSSFYGQFIGLDNVTYFADLTQPWAITWNPGSNEVSITFTPKNEVGTITATILNADVARSVTLNGQWVIDTDLYSVGSHVEEVFNWDFGNWGLTKTQFIVCAMGLTALLSIAFRLAHVPIRGLDFVVIFFGNLIMWVVL